YTSNELKIDFPGRIFKVIATVSPDPKKLKPYFVEGKANVITRNYPMEAEALKKKSGLKDGGEKYLIGFSSTKKKIVVVADRIA
ncbi:MAG: class I SAM-dependent methyltransferase, partial [Cyclobacteriaceae bacterium]|nr:class I SAM-dependent methyltransferase [Cyclobacteriaceae bacterium]